MSQLSEKRCVVVTGASSGIGRASAEAFVRMGWHVIGTGRDKARCEAAEAALRALSSEGGKVDFLRGDFAEMRDVRRIAQEIAALTDEVHVLVNNAGGIRDGQYFSQEGLEWTFAANHLAPFLLTRELLPLLERAAQNSPAGTVRVIGVSSLGHFQCPALNFDDLMLGDNYNAGAAYCQAKLCNILFTRELNRKVADKGIIAHAMHPGKVGSNFSSHGEASLQAYMATQDLIPPEQPARTIVWAATAPENGVDGGRYFYDLAEAEVAPQGQDDAAAQRLWVESERILENLGAAISA